MEEAAKFFCLCSQNAAQVEIRMLAFHDLAWTHMMGMEFAEAQMIFHNLYLNSRWAMLLYLYLETINKGANGNVFSEDDLIHFQSVFENPPSENQMESLLIRRFKYIPKRFVDLEEKTTLYWRSLVYEILYLWNSLPNCKAENIITIIQECEALHEDNVNRSMIGLDKLISGFCYKIMGDIHLATVKFRNGLSERKDLPKSADDAHITAFLNYELGVILINNIDTKLEGKKYLQQTRLIKSYDFEHRISARVNVLLKNL